MRAEVRQSGSRASVTAEVGEQVVIKAAAGSGSKFSKVTVVASVRCRGRGRGCGLWVSNCVNFTLPLIHHVCCLLSAVVYMPSQGGLPCGCGCGCNVSVNTKNKNRQKADDEGMMGDG